MLKELKLCIRRWFKRKLNSRKKHVKKKLQLEDAVSADSPMDDDETTYRKLVYSSDYISQHTENIGNMLPPSDVETSILPIKDDNDINPEIKTADCEIVHSFPDGNLQQRLYDYFSQGGLQELKFDIDNETEPLKFLGSSCKLSHTGISYPVTDVQTSYNVYFTSEGASDQHRDDSSESSAVSDQHGSDEPPDMEGVIINLGENIQQQQQNQQQHGIDLFAEGVPMVNLREQRMFVIFQPPEHVQQRLVQHPRQDRFQCNVSIAQERQAGSHLQNLVDLQQARPFRHFINLQYHRHQHEAQIRPWPGLLAGRNQNIGLNQLYPEGIGDRQQETEQRALQDIPPQEMVNIHQVIAQETEQRALLDIPPQEMVNVHRVIAQESVEQRQRASCVVISRNVPQVQTGALECYRICSFGHITCFVRCSRCSARGDIWCQALQAPLCQLHHQELHPT